MCGLTKKYSNKTTAASAHGFGFYPATVKKDQGDCSLSSKNQQFTYAEIINMTNNFERIIRRGGFGTVYYDEMDGTQVAVKMLSEESIKMLAHPSQFSIQFQTEVQILMRIHHRNLVPFLGYCNEATKRPPFMTTNRNAKKLNWGQRLRIALDVAQGLECLHSGCKPQVVHRDVKTTNFLLNGRLEAKILPPRGLNSCIHCSQRHKRQPRSRVLHYQHFNGKE
ncbi:hypothetical protein AAC387_Pa03g4428 [Persea americana]